MKFCPNCGNQVDDSAKVCGYCGTPFVQPEAPAQPAQPQFQQPAQPQFEQPAQPQFQQPAQPQFQQPAQPQFQQPAQPQFQQPAQPQFQQPQYQQPYQQGGFAPAYGQPQPAKKKTGLIIGIIAAVVVIAVAVVLILVLGGGTKAFTIEEGVGTWESEFTLDMDDVIDKMGVESQGAEMLKGQSLKFIFTLSLSSDGTGTIRGRVDPDSFRTMMKAALKNSGLDDSMVELYLGQVSPEDMFDSSDLSTSVTVKGDMLYGDNVSGALSSGAKLEFKGGDLVLNKPEGRIENDDIMSVMFPMTFTKK